MAKSSENSNDEEKDALGRTKKKPAPTMTPSEIRDFAAIFREPERQLIEIAKEMEDAEIDEIQPIVQGIETKVEEALALIYSQFRQKMEKAAFKAGKRARKRFGR